MLLFKPQCLKQITAVIICRWSVLWLVTVGCDSCSYMYLCVNCWLAPVLVSHIAAEHKQLLYTGRDATNAVNSGEWVIGMGAVRSRRVASLAVCTAFSKHGDLNGPPADCSRIYVTYITISAVVLDTMRSVLYIVYNVFFIQKCCSLYVWIL